MAQTVDVYLSDFRADVKTDDILDRQIVELSCGRTGHRTPMFDLGELSPRQIMHVSSKYPPPHGGAEMPFALFFHKSGRLDLAGCAFHQGDTFAPSHGCIHLGRADAEWLFHWAGTAPVTVSVHGPYPALSVRAHVYAIGAQGMLPRVIAAINTRLAELGLLAKPADETFDEASADAVRRFQSDRHLHVDGVVGPNETGPALGIRI